MSEEINEKMQPEVVEQSAVSVNDDGDIKLDMRQFNEQANADTVEETADVVADQPAEPLQEVEAEVPQQREPVQNEEPAEENVTFLEEITEEEVVEVTEQLQDEVADAIEESIDKGVDLPENIQKVVDFMDETGGNLEDYVKLNTDVEALNEEQLLMEYYQNTKPHLDVSEINFLLEDKFSYEDEVDEERDIKRMKNSKPKTNEKMKKKRTKSMMDSTQVKLSGGM